MKKMTVACFVMSTALWAQPALPKYKVVKGYPGAANIAAINAAADQGYRVAFAYQSTVLRLESIPPDTYRYLPLPQARAGASFLNTLNQQGALGYRWVDTLLEKEPHPRNYEYRTAEGFTLNSRDASAEELVREGFEQIGESLGGVVYIRELGNSDIKTRRPSRVLYERTGKNFMKKIGPLAREGYRYRSKEPIRGGRRGLMMELCDSSCGGAVEYRSFDVKEAAQLEHDLNSLGAEGFRVLPNSLYNEPYLAERTAAARQSYSYRVISVSDDQAVEDALNAGDREGYDALGVAAHVGWTAHVFVILKKTIASTAP